MGLKAKAKSRHRALVKVVLFIVRVQKSQKKTQEQKREALEGNRSRSNVVPLLRCSTVPTLPLLFPRPEGTGDLSPRNASISPSTSNTCENGDSSLLRYSPHRSSRDLSAWHHLKVPNQHASFLSVCDDEDKHGLLSVGSASNASPYSRSRTSSSVSRCSYNSKNSGGADSLSSTGACDEEIYDADGSFDRQCPTFMDFTNMNKPYTLNGFGELVTNGTVVSGPRPSVKNITITCNSVMGDPRKLSRKLLRRGSALEACDERFAVRPSTSGIIQNGTIANGSQNQQRQKKESASGKAPMIRQRTADASGSRAVVRHALHRCTSDENVAAAGAAVVLESEDISPQTARKFVKRKSSADLLMTSYDATAGNLSTSTLERLSGLAAGVMSKSSVVSQSAKADKKKMQKMKENMKQLLELFTAVEQDDIGKVRSILHHGEVNINGTNADDLTALDVATMLNHTEVSLLLLKHGAQENQRLSNVNHRFKHLQSLIESAQTKLAELTLAASKQASSNGAGSSSTLSKNLDKQISSWESRLHTLKKMRHNLENTALPPHPKSIVITVTSSTSLLVAMEPPDQNNGVVVTKYRIEWSHHEDFSDILGNICIYDLRRLETTITNLPTGVKYHVRVSAGTYRGFGEPCSSQPPFAAPSSWRDIDQTRERGAGRLEAITELYHELRKLKKTDLWERIAYTGDVAMKKKKHSTATLKSLFSSNAKFQRNLKRGVYLASILYKEDKVLCTVDDCLPVVEVDETVPASLGPDFQWLMKLSCAWEDMRSLHFDADLANQSPSLMFRLQLLEAAAAMQAGLGVQDLGRLHSTPIIDSKGVTVLVTVHYVHDSKSVQGLAVKWVLMNKLLRKQSACQEKDLSAMDLLVGGFLNLLNFYESTYIPLDRGLYLGFVKLHTSINQISIVVPETLPSVLPFVFIRDNPHVSKEEWEWLRIVDKEGAHDVTPSSSQLAFHWAIASAARVLLNDLDVDNDQIPTHRIYRLEVVEIHSDVSFILLVPSHDDVCLPPGQPRILTEEKRGCIALPVPMFEVAHLCTYQPDFIALYCRLSVFLEFYSVVLQQLHRQTLNEDDAKTYRHLLDTLAIHQQRLEEVWKAARWITYVVTAARDRHLRSSLPLSVLFAYTSTSASFTDIPKSQSSDAVATGANEPKSPSIRRQFSESDAVAIANSVKRRSLLTDTRESATVADRGANAMAGPLQRRPRRLSSGERSQSEDVGEENSDVGYHSDQSVEKLASAHAAVRVNCAAASGGAGALAASNPTYDFPERLLQNRPCYVNCDNGLPGMRGEGDEKTVLSADNMEYLVNKLNFVQRPIIQSNSKLIESRYGKFNAVASSAQVHCNSNSISNPESGRLKQPSPANPVPTYRTEIVVGETSDHHSVDGAVFDARVNTRPSPMSSNRQFAHDYVNVVAACTAVAVGESPKRKAGCVILPSSAASDSEASCASTSTTSSSQSRLRQQADAIWVPDASDRIVEDLSVIDKLYAEATARLPPHSTPGPHAVPTTSVLHVASSPRPPSAASSTRSAASSSSDRSRGTVRVQSPQAGLLRVYAAYPCGLTKGTSVKLHITPKTTAREVVVLVVRQLNKAAEMKGVKGPFYDDEELNDFVLVAVIGARERCLRDDFPPLELQNPWCKGKLFVRRKNDLLAALEFGNEAKV